MVPAAAVDKTLHESWPLTCSKATSSIDGGKSTTLTTSGGPRIQAQGIHYVDAGTSGGVWGSERGYCFMIGGEQSIVQSS